MFDEFSSALSTMQHGEQLKAGWEFSKKHINGIALTAAALVLFFSLFPAKEK